MFPRIVVSLCLAAFCFSPSVQAAMIQGVVKPAAKAKSVKAVDRAAGKTYAGEVSANTGRFVIKGLPAGEYDLIFETTDGRIEGVNLEPPDDEASQRPLRKKDADAIIDWVAHVKSFMDKKTVLSLRGNGKHCRALVELLRDRPFHSGKADEIIWRLEIWAFDNYTGAWLKRDRGGAQVLYRKRMDRYDFERMRAKWAFAPDLGGIVVGANDRIKNIVCNVADYFGPNKKPIMPEFKDDRHKENLDDAVIDE